MSYTARPITELVRISAAEVAHASRLDASVQLWNAYIEQLFATTQNLVLEAQQTSEQWPDAAGDKFTAAIEASLKSMKGKLFAATHQEVREQLAGLKTEIGTTDTEVRAAYEEYRQALINDPMADVAALAKAASQRAGAALDTLAKSYVTVAQGVRKAAGPGIRWVGPEEGAGPATPGGGPAGGPSAAPSAAAPSAMDGAAGQPPGGAPAGTGAAPSLAGGGAPAPPALPPAAGLKPLPPLSPPPLPPLAPPPIVPSRSTTPPRPGAVPGSRGAGRPGVLGAVSALGALPVTPPKTSAATTSGVLPQATPPPPPATGGATAAPGKPSVSGAVPPMAPPLAGGRGARTKPKPGAADPATQRTGRAPRTVPGVPETLRGSAGKLDSKQAFLFPVGRPKPEDSESDTVELVDEDLWRVEESGHHRPLG